MDGVFSGLIGQEAAVAVLREAAGSARATTAAGDGEGARAMSHAWLITGPPGSGRSVAATAFAAALQCTGEPVGCGQCPGCRTTLAKTNADVVFVATETSIITVDTARSLVQQAQSSPSQGKWRVLVVEDADRLGESGANALLKAIEEPPAHTVWLLCAPSPEDMIATIRSRCRCLGLRIPRAGAVADLLVDEGVADPETALEAARAAQSHIGLARALARDPQMRQRRREIITAPARVRSVGEAVIAAGRLLETARAQADAQVGERNAREKSELLRQLGMDEGERATKQSRALLRQLEEDQKRRAKRALTDALDRALVDLLAIYRDVLMVQLDSRQELINTDLSDLVHGIAADSSPAQTMARVDHIEQARRRLIANGNVLLVLEAMVVSLRPQA
ncbi:DNA polymerase III subunit delta' [Pauljensenia hongkongensis]|uniref:DNA polymerase III subunit delta n=1 Tax=Pauljensenia hongkongensis TaxID=178339 RepID=A0A1D8B3S1_9ACTO|nr:DNA polymerase III subunit delta' [Pauljensenia hongkongensis]AOS47759.1 DNA polymerase III subunit delta' [Pauljensenia hongkongensis]EFW09322.1 DNA-directed DNA polymerase III subunit delta' [Actinomyces sp. oral taxon 178 str. F0338]